jgi:hypothetical protein
MIQLVNAVFPQLFPKGQVWLPRVLEYHALYDLVAHLRRAESEVQKTPEEVAVAVTKQLSSDWLFISVIDERGDQFVEMHRL